jgi:hypothetical protein
MGWPEDWRRRVPGRALDHPLWPGDPSRLLSDDAFAVLSWREEPRAVGGGYWWPERLALPPSVMVDGPMQLPFVPYEPAGAKPVAWRKVLSGQWRSAAKRRRVANRPVCVAPGEGPDGWSFYAMPKGSPAPGLEPYLRLHPGRDEPAWAWRRSDQLRGVSFWILPGREEEFLADAAAGRLRGE